MLNNCIPPEAFFYGTSDATGKRGLQAKANTTGTMPTDEKAYTTPAPEGKWFVYDPSQQNGFLTPAGNSSSTNSSAAQEEAESSPSYNADPTVGDHHDAALWAAAPGTSLAVALGAFLLAILSHF